MTTNKLFIWIWRTRLSWKLKKRKFIEILNSKDKIDTTRSFEELHQKKSIWEVSVLETEGSKR